MKCKCKCICKIKCNKCNTVKSTFRDFFLMQYEEFLKSQKSTKEEDKTEWKFKFGDITPKQGYNTYEQYIKDGACQRTPRESKFTNTVKENLNQKTKRKFGILWTC